MVAELEVGSVFAGDFRIERPLSSGGMGSVFVVTQLSTGSMRALKLMRPEIVADPTLRERFLQEARIGARIPSDHVVSVIASGVDGASGVPWLAMELLVGEDLEARVKRLGPRPHEETILAIRQVGHALKRAHAAGVIHRDLKPGNLFFAESRSADVPFQMKILDFGIAKLVDEAQTGSTMSVGTPLWMAPEQSERSGRIGPQTDLWPLGLIVFYLLTGRLFWLSANDGTTSLPTLMREVLFESVAPPSQRAAALGCAALWPPALDGWFLRLVERDPQRRERDVDAVVTGLEQALRGISPPRTGGYQPFALSSPGPVGAAPGGSTRPPHAPSAPHAPPATQVGAPLAASHAVWAPAPIHPAAPVQQPSAASRRGLLFVAAVVVLAASVAGGALLVGSRRRPVKVDESRAVDEPRPRRRMTECQALAALVQRVSNAENLPSSAATAAELARLRDGLEVHAADAPWKGDAQRALTELFDLEMHGSEDAEPALWPEFVNRHAARCAEVRRAREEAAQLEAPMAPEPDPEVADDGANP